MVPGVEKPDNPLIGVGSSGELKTAEAKEYPAALNRAFASAFMAKLSCLPQHSGTADNCQDVHLFRQAKPPVSGESQAPHPARPDVYGKTIPVYVAGRASGMGAHWKSWSHIWVTAEAYTTA